MDVEPELESAHPLERPVGAVSLTASLRALLPFDLGEEVEFGDELFGPDGSARLVFVADVSHLPVGDLLGLAHASGGSGLLLFGHRDEAKSVYLHRGEVVFAASNLAGDRLGECLIRAGMLTIDQLCEAEQAFTPDQRFGKVLVEKGFLAPRDLWHGVKFQVEEIVRSLFAYTAGAVHLFAGDVKPDNVVRLSLPTRRLVAEGIQQREDLKKFKGLLEDPGVQLLPVEGAGSRLSGPDGLLFDALALESSFPAVCEQLDVEPLATARAVQMLRFVGAIKLVRSPRAVETLPESDLLAEDEEALRECIEAHVKLLHELARPLAEVEGEAPVTQRLERVLEDTSHRFPALLAGVRFESGPHIDPDQLLQRALRLADDPEHQVRMALGELVSYLEFELKNHPRIPAPDTLLASLETLRERI